MDFNEFLKMKLDRMIIENKNEIEDYKDKIKEYQNKLIEINDYIETLSNDIILDEMLIIEYQQMLNKLP